MNVLGDAELLFLADAAKVVRLLIPLYLQVLNMMVQIQITDLLIDHDLLLNLQLLSLEI